MTKNLDPDPDPDPDPGEGRSDRGDRLWSQHCNRMPRSTVRMEGTRLEAPAALLRLGAQGFGFQCFHS